MLCFGLKNIDGTFFLRFERKKKGTIDFLKNKGPHEK